MMNQAIIDNRRLLTEAGVDLAALTELLATQGQIAVQAEPGAQRLGFLRVGRQLLGVSEPMFRDLQLIGRSPKGAQSGAARFRGSHDLRQFVAAIYETRPRSEVSSIVSAATPSAPSPTRGPVQFQPKSRSE